jgi:hypothetical protein
MIKAYNAKFSTTSSSSPFPHIKEAIVGDLISPSPPSPPPNPPNEPPYTAFDLAFVVHVMKVVVAVAVLMNVVLTHCEVWKGAEYEMEN